MGQTDGWSRSFRGSRGSTKPMAQSPTLATRLNFRTSLAPWSTKSTCDFDPVNDEVLPVRAAPAVSDHSRGQQIGRESGRERGCQYGKNWGAAVSIKKKKTK